MSKELFYAPQTYALALECGRKLMANESEEDKLVPVIHQMNTRIYNSAFCGILRTGYPFTIEKDENGNPTFIKMEIDGMQHACPYTSVSNTLRGEFATVLESGGYPELAATSPKKKQASKLNETKTEHATNTAAQPPTEEETKKINAKTNTEKRDIKNTGIQHTKPASAAHEIPVSRVIPTFGSVLPDIHANVPVQKPIPETTTAASKKEAEEKVTNTAKTVVVPTAGPFAETIPSTPLEEKPELDLDAIVATMDNSAGGTFASGKVPGNNNASVALSQTEQDADAHELPVNTNLDSNTPDKSKTVDDLPTPAHAYDVESKQDAAMHESENTPENKPVTSSKLTMDQNTPDTSAQEKDSASEIRSSELHTEDMPVIQDASEKTVPDGMKSESDVPEEANEDAGMDDYSAFDAPVLDDEAESTHQDIKVTQENEMPDKDTEQSQTVADQSKRADVEDPMPFEPKKNANPIQYEETMQNTNDAALEKTKPKHGFIASLLGIGSKNAKTEPAENGSLPEFQPNTKEKAVASNAEPNEQTPMQNMTEAFDKKEERAGEAETEKTGEEVKDRANHNHTVADKAPTPASTSEPVQNNTELAKPDHSQDGGALFQHVHQVTVKPKFGDAVLSQVKFIIWPTRIVEMYPGRTFADLLIYVVDKNGVERSYCTERGQDMITITTSDNKEFNVYGIWDNGHFTSYVTLTGRTESQNRMEETIEKAEPERTDSDAFLDQFRLERKGQPAHFIVPFKDHNCGEQNIPITGYVELRGRKYPLERREGNMLRYRYNANEKVIRGHWENGSFKFGLSDVTLIDWSREEEEEGRH